MKPLLFPLKSTKDVLALFRKQMESDGPDLALISITTGMIENTLTSKCVESTSTSPAGEVIDIQFDVISELYNKFKTILSVVEKNKEPFKTNYASRELIKRVSDVIWNSLIRSTYKDRAHLQSLYSYLAGSKLDCFGVALAVVAGCQCLGYIDVHLALSEDHAWVVFGKSGLDTVEVTWHGKGTEDKRGQSVTIGYESHSWLYLSGNPVICDRHMEVAAIVSSINPSLNLTSACLEVADLQQQLLWLLYDLKHLQKYPMGLGALGELEEVSPTADRPSCEQLYEQSVKASRTHYKNHHVYPYTYQGGYYYRQNMYKEAFSAWANAGDVIRLYNYSRDDEEIYKEFLDIANELIPLIMKTESSGHSAKSVLRDPQCFANLLRFYDGICQWEEGSHTNILHIGWAKPLVTTIGRFDSDIRSQVIINCGRDDEDVTKQTEGESNNNIASDSNEKPEEKPNDTVLSTLEALTAACGEKILNPEFLLQGGGQPFAEQQQIDVKPAEDDEKNVIVKSEYDSKSGETSEQNKSKDKGSVTPQISTEISAPVYEPPQDVILPKRPTITLYSRKMKGIKDLLLAEKLNTQAISLQVTAQSQVQVGGKKGRSMPGSLSSAKRSRRQ
ncbi:Menin [Pseudolycoriella hygida]|uniref:Menin n=1 Tax=Pseudolycoriella hygida TaxID=35572 RepID=A0A9Q0N9Y9_9DIPT|nr:Menin [Pseudolycoriella hygida]